MQARRVIGTSIPHPTLATHIAGPCDPHPCEGNAGLLCQPVNDGSQHLVNRAFARDTNREFLQSFEMHGAILKT